MARVKHSTIKKARKAVDSYRDCPSCPSKESLLTSNTALFNTVNIIGSRAGSVVPVKTLCGLMVTSMELASETTGEALWKRYRREKARRERRETPIEDTVCSQSNEDIPNGDESEENGDAPNPLVFIDPKVSQTALADALAEFFEDQGYSCDALLRTCLMALERMDDAPYLPEIRKAVDSWAERPKS